MEDTVLVVDFPFRATIFEGEFAEVYLNGCYSFDRLLSQSRRIC
jgi:hypothetical protein